MTASVDRRHLFIRACLGEMVERTPVWAMRQAGRWDPLFARLRGERDFYEFSRDAQSAAEASLCPRRFGVDAIILFYDITTLAVAMGQRFELVPQRGPVPDIPIQSLSDVRKLASNPDPAQYQHVLHALRLVREALHGELPILVFAAAPFTLATYQLGTGKDMSATRQRIAEQPSLWSELLQRNCNATVRFLRSLLDEGADAYQLFDSWAGPLDRGEYMAHCQSFHRHIFDAVGGVSILFVKDGEHLDLMVESRAKVISLGTVHDLAAALRRFPQTTFQGNVDHRILVTGSTEEVRCATNRCLTAGSGRRHILNLDHGMDPAAQPDNFAAFVACSHEHSQWTKLAK